MYRKTYVEVDIDKIKSNIEQMISQYKYKYYIGVVKGNAYGHGEYIINDMIDSGINYLAVSSLEEALRIRKYNENIPVLCLEPIELDGIEECIKSNVTITVHDKDYLDQLLDKNFKGKLKAHLKIDSGMNRLGFKNKTAFDYAYNKIIKSNKIMLEGVYSHFATTGVNDKQWDNQLAKFRLMLSGIDLTTIPIIHFGKSNTVLNHEKIDICNGTRFGISMYGYDQTPKFSNTIKGKLKRFKRYLKMKLLKISPTEIENSLNLQPALSFYSNIIQVKKVHTKEYVGYGSGSITKKPIIVGVMPVGYADGLFKSNKNRAVIINNKRYYLFGEICMGMVDVIIDDDVKVGNIVTLIGDEITNREVSRYNKASVYETMTCIPKNIPRVYKKNGKIVYIEE